MAKFENKRRNKTRLIDLIDPWTLRLSKGLAQPTKREKRERVTSKKRRKRGREKERKKRKKKEQEGGRKEKNKALELLNKLFLLSFGDSKVSSCSFKFQSCVKMVYKHANTS